MRRSRAIAVGAALMLLVGLFGLVWLFRFRLATSLVDARLASSGVPVAYRLTRVGPFAERIEQLRIGDPAAPDLVARRIDVLLGYGLGGPVAREIRAEGVVVRARLDGGGLSLGAIDRLSPRTGGGQTALPDLRVVLRDVRLALATPNGDLSVSLDGAGNPQRRFVGQARISAPEVRVASCRLSGLSAAVAITARAGQPEATGPVRVARTTCPDLVLGEGRMRVDLTADRGFGRLRARASLAGFAGRAGPVRFAGLSGPVEAAGRFGALDAHARIMLASLSAPEIARRVAAASGAAEGTPLGPTLVRGSQALARLLSDADAEGELVAAVRGSHVDLNVRSARLRGRDGAYVAATAQGGLGWTAAGWRADADVVAGGGELPPLALRLRQAAPGGPLAGTGGLGPYRAGSARVAAAPLRVTWIGQHAAIEARLAIDGPVANGFIRGLELPVRGWVGRDGAFEIGGGCRTLAWRSLRLASFTFAAARLPLCGDPLVARTASGETRVALSSGPVRLEGRTDDGTPLALGAQALRLDDGRFAARRVVATIGEGVQPTRIAAAELAGRVGGHGMEGTFAGVSGTIGAVPIAVTGGDGRWTIGGGALRLAGALRASDAAETPRFHPLVADDAVLGLENGVIAATATLREPATRGEVARVDLRHDLARASGRALLDLRGIRFVPKGLQPEMLTPLTLGVIANVAGTVAGTGRIAWDRRGITSAGTFGTDRLDLAAAFGPVTGLKGQLRFTDLLGLVSAPDQEATVAEINPGVAIANGVVRYRLPGENRVVVQSADWPFAGGTLRLEPTTLDFAASAERRLTFRLAALDAAAFVQQLDFPNISVTGTFDGVLPMVFGPAGGRIVAGSIAARPPGGSLAYLGELSNAQLGTMGKLAFDALKAIRYSTLDIRLDGQLDGEMISRVRFTGIREATPDRNLVARLIRNLPFRFNIEIRAPFRGLVGSAKAYLDPRLLLQPPPTAPGVQPAASELVR